MASLRRGQRKPYEMLRRKEGLRRRNFDDAITVHREASIWRYQDLRLDFRCADRYENTAIRSARSSSKTNSKRWDNIDARKIETSEKHSKLKSRTTVVDGVMQPQLGYVGLKSNVMIQH
ncbi:uncharacterized protein LOC143264528 [Megachile rotundata]|uniref:uncharacterized protein LOC143264528 n=1 Tax=Megachile rotundata TaxID=143995 RepID=UPI003FD52700